MKVHTSYFAMESKLPEGYVPVSISLYTPDWFKGWCHTRLAPTSSMLFDYKRDPHDERYTESYRRIILEQLSPKEMWESLERIGAENIVLMCWEKPGKFCHRHLVAEWLTKAGYPVEELKFEADNNA